jgi:exodeoxyribonuclease-3
MRIISYNVNGIRAAIRKGFLDWLHTQPADIICLQEIKATQDDIDYEVFQQAGYQTFWYAAQKKGYSGVAMLTNIAPQNVMMGIQTEQSDYEGRVLRADFGELTVLNAYFPSGTSGEVRQTYKYQWLNEFMDYVNELGKERPQLVICGDYNIAHTEIDIHDPKGNKKSSGFLPEERAWLTSFFQSGFIDTFREKHPNVLHQYTWWSSRFPTVRLQNKGWRIDYISVSNILKNKIVEAKILSSVQHSDHCPVYVELNV